VRIPRRDGVAPHVEIDENKAVLVRRIFNLYAKQGLTVRLIAKQLTLQGTPAPGGGQGLMIVLNAPLFLSRTKCSEASAI
jgi:hypothetical protein